MAYKLKMNYATVRPQKQIKYPRIKGEKRSSLVASQGHKGVLSSTGDGKRFMSISDNKSISSDGIDGVCCCPVVGLVASLIKLCMLQVCWPRRQQKNKKKKQF